MQWSMPRPVLQVVAALILLIAAGAFILGVFGAPPKARLPGERAQVADDGGVTIDAAEAVALGDERIEGPPPPKELTPEEKAKLEEEKKAKEEAEAAAKLAEGVPPAKAAPVAPGPAAPAADRVGDLLDSVTPPPEEPPH